MINLPRPVLHIHFSLFTFSSGLLLGPPPQPKECFYRNSLAACEARRGSAAVWFLFWLCSPSVGEKHPARLLQQRGNTLHFLTASSLSTGGLRASSASVWQISKTHTAFTCGLFFHGRLTYQWEQKLRYQLRFWRTYINESAGGRVDVIQLWLTSSSLP